MHASSIKEIDKYSIVLKQIESLTLEVNVVKSICLLWCLILSQSRQAILGVHCVNNALL